MSRPAISVRSLSKRYRLGGINRHTLVDEATYWWHKLRGKDPREHFHKIGHSATERRRVEAETRDDKDFWALRDVSFDVRPGEVVGVIGRNGAGKSTLLKILTRITEPTAGEITLNGRVASLLEVGTGFHPELTGRENIYMNGAILGMKRREIAAKFDEIVEFSEIAKFIDTPVKRYSSGMYVRLAFAVAAHLEPEILLVDEVLAVGDAAFQAKCIGKMGEVAKQGRTVLFVSHQLASVARLCGTGLYLKEGRTEMFGNMAPVLERYLEEKDAGPEGVYVSPENGEAPCIRAARVLDAKGQASPHVDGNKAFGLEVDLDLTAPPIENLTLSVSIKNLHETRLCTVEMPCERLGFRGEGRVCVEFPGGVLLPGAYTFLMALHVPNRRILQLVPSACRMHLEDTGGPLSQYRTEAGVFNINARWVADGREVGP